jgi:hypothetical protein
VWVNDKKGVIDKSGNFIAQPIYDDISNLDYSQGYTAIVQKNKKWGCIDLKAGGTLIGDIVFDEFESFQEGLAQVTLNGKIGFIDRKGHMAIPAIYDAADNISNGLIFVVKDKKGFYINRFGVQVTNY